MDFAYPSTLLVVTITLKETYMRGLFIFISCITVACAQQKGESLKGNLVEERIRLKNAAFCTCVYKSFPDSVFRNEGSAAAYLELGAHSLDAYTKVMDAAKEYSKKQYQSFHNRNLALMKCLDFYNSQDLTKLILELDSEIDQTKVK